MPSWSQVQALVGEFGLLKGVFLLFFFLAHAWIYHLYMARLADRQRELSRLAADNSEYRERFVRMLDQQMGYVPPPPRPPPEKLKKGGR